MLGYKWGEGSAAELRTQVYIASRLGIIGKAERQEMVGELKTISKMLHGLIKSLD